MIPQKTVISKSFFYTSLHTFGTNIINILVGVGTSILVARLLGPAGKGSFDLVQATAWLLFIVFNFSLTNGITYVVAKKPVAIGRLNFILAGIIFLQSLAASFVVIMVSKTPFYMAFIPEKLTLVLLFSIISITAMLLTQNYGMAILVGKQQFVENNRLNLLYRVLFVIALGIWLILSALGVEINYLHACFSFAGALGIVSLLYLRNEYAFFREGTNSFFSQIIAYSIPAHFSNVAQYLNYRLDTFFVGFFQGTANVGLYMLAVSLSQLIWLLPRALAQNLIPRIAVQQDIEQSAWQISRLCRLNFMVAFCLACGLALAGYFLIPIVYGSDFKSSFVPLMLILPGAVFFIFVILISAFFSGIGNPKLNLFGTLSGLLVTVILDIYLIPKYSIQGAAIASTASYMISGIMMLLIFQSKTKQSIAEALFLKKDDLFWVLGKIKKTGDRNESI